MTIDSTRTRGIAILAMAAFIVGTVMMAAPASVLAARGISVQAWLGSPCVNGRAADKATVRVTWRDDDGSMKQKGTVAANKKGWWSLCGDGNELIAKGDTVKVQVKSRTRTVTVPKLKLGIDRVSEEVTGKGPASTSIELIACRHTSYDKVTCSDKVLVTEPDGTFLHDFSPQADLKGRDWVTLVLARGRDTFIRSQNVPFIAVARGKARFWGYFKPFKMVAVELRNGGDALRDEWAGRADDWDWGFFRGRFADDQGDTVRVKSGNKVIVPKFGADADWTVPAVSVSTSKGTDVVSGTCAGPNRPFQIRAWSANGNKFGRRTGITSGSGTFSKDMTKRIDLKRGYVVWVSCSLPSGDLVERRTVVN